jgi:uncharacterized RDD family membrane protein YckC
MTEIDLSQAVTSWAALAYTSSQWWLTVTTALVIATYLAARHIPAWLFALVALLYVLTAISVIFEVSEYSQLSYSYSMRLTDLRVANHEIGAVSEPSALSRYLNNFLNLSIFAVGSLGALAFSFIHWRKARTT